MSQQKVTFKNQNWDVAAILQFPENFDANKKYPRSQGPFF